MFHGKSLWPSIKGTDSSNCVATSSRSSNGAPADTRNANGTATPAAAVINSIDVTASHCLDGRSHSVCVCCDICFIVVGFVVIKSHEKKIEREQEKLLGKFFFVLNHIFTRFSYLCQEW